MALELLEYVVIKRIERLRPNLVQFRALFYLIRK